MQAAHEDMNQKYYEEGLPPHNITGTTTTQILQPAYSQASHCAITGSITCVTPGQDPSTQTCTREEGCGPVEGLTHQQAGQSIGACHSGDAQCFVRHP
jgi:hypothetical protein